jgi:hypothetical protein
MTEHPPVLPHGNIEEAFPDVFFVTGAMKTVLMGGHWHFSRNMTIVREGGELTLINTVRLDEAGLDELEKLGKVANVVKIGSLHGRDDAFYVERYGAKFWAGAGMKDEHGLKPDKELVPGGETPFAGCTVFAFRMTKLPELILRIDRAGGILVAADALQNWIKPNEFFSDESRAMMTEMGFFKRANIGPVWARVNEPKADDFARLRQLSFQHVLCGHGEPLRDDAKEAFSSRIAEVFGV